jgi:hypothetical protein
MDLRQTRCPLLLVADYRFFSEMGGGSSKTTVMLQVSILLPRSYNWYFVHAGQLPHQSHR